MSKIIDLGAFNQDDLIFKTSCGKEYSIPCDVSVDFMIKMYSLQEEISKCKTQVEQLSKLQKLVYYIVSINQSDDFTYEEFIKDKDFSFIKRLNKVVEIFWDFMNKSISESIPAEEQSPNAQTPEEN